MTIPLRNPALIRSIPNRYQGVDAVSGSLLQ